MNGAVQHPAIDHAERLWFFAQANSEFPSMMANNVQVMKACNGFAQAAQPTTLVVPRRPRAFRRAYPLHGDVWEAFGVPRSFVLAECAFPYPLHLRQETLYAPLATLYAQRRRARLVFTRSHWIAMLLGGLGIPATLEMHYAPLPMQRLLLRAAQRGQIAGLVCISQALADDLRAFGFDETLILTAHDGVDLERFEPRLDKQAARARLQLAPHGTLVCYAGHFAQEYGIETILACAQRLPATTFLFVGGKPEQIAHYRTLAAHAGLSNTIFVGRVPNTHIPLYLYAADVLVMPFTHAVLTQRFMSPMKMFEYLAAGRVIVAADFPVLREVLTDQHDALLVEPANVAAFTQALQRAFSDPALAARLADEARRTAARYTWQDRQTRILQFMRERRSALARAHALRRMR